MDESVARLPVWLRDHPETTLAFLGEENTKFSHVEPLILAARQLHHTKAIFATRKQAIHSYISPPEIE